MPALQKKRRGSQERRSGRNAQARRRPAPPPRYNRMAAGKTARQAIRPTAAAAPTDTPDAKPGMCHGCPAHCCSIRVDLTLFDVARIHHLEGIGPASFIEFIPAGHDDAFGFRTAYGPVKMILRKKDGACVFKRKGTLMCGIEKSKPAVCLAYPFGISYGIPYIQRKVVCPKDNFARADRAKMSAQVLEDVSYEASCYADAIAVWNRHAKGNERPEQFLAFAANDIETDKQVFGQARRHLGRLLLRAGLR